MLASCYQLASLQCFKSRPTTASTDSTHTGTTFLFGRSPSVNLTKGQNCEYLRPREQFNFEERTKKSGNSNAKGFSQILVVWLKLWVDTYLIFVTYITYGKCGEQICHVEKYPISIYDRCGEIWNFCTCGVISNFAIWKMWRNLKFLHIWHVCDIMMWRMHPHV